MNFDMNQVLSSKWMAKEDVPVQGVDLIIRQITQEAVGDEMEEKYAMHFHGSYKPLLLNRTNIRIVMSLYGPKSESWLNNPICVYNDPTISYGGRLTGGVRLRMPTNFQPLVPPQQQQATPFQPQATPQQYRQASGAQVPNADGELADDVPF